MPFKYYPKNSPPASDTARVNCNIRRSSFQIHETFVYFIKIFGNDNAGNTLRGLGSHYYRNEYTGRLVKQSLNSFCERVNANRFSAQYVNMNIMKIRLIKLQFIDDKVRQGFCKSMLKRKMIHTFATFFHITFVNQNKTGSIRESHKPQSTYGRFLSPAENHRAAVVQSDSVPIGLAEIKVCK